jgi:hypothetical protein
MLCFLPPRQRAALQSLPSALSALDLWLDVCRRLSRVLNLLSDTEDEVNTSDAARALVFQCAPAMWSVLVSAHTLMAKVGSSSHWARRVGCASVLSCPFPSQGRVARQWHDTRA